MSAALHHTSNSGDNDHHSASRHKSSSSRRRAAAAAATAAVPPATIATHTNGHDTSSSIPSVPSLPARGPPRSAPPAVPVAAASVATAVGVTSSRHVASIDNTMSPPPSPPLSPQSSRTSTIPRRVVASSVSLSSLSSSNGLPQSVISPDASPHPSLMYASNGHRAPMVSSIIPTLAGIASPPPKGHIVTAQPVASLVSSTSSSTLPERRTRGGWIRFGDCIELHDEKRGRCISTGELWPNLGVAKSYFYPTFKTQGPAGFVVHPIEGQESLFDKVLTSDEDDFGDDDDGLVAVRLEDQRTATKAGILRSLPSSVVASITGAMNGHIDNNDHNNMMQSNGNNDDMKRTSSFNHGASSMSSTSISSISDDGTMTSTSSTSSMIPSVTNVVPPSFGAALSESLSMLLTFSFESNPAPSHPAPLTCLTLPSLRSVASPSSSSVAAVETPKKVAAKAVDRGDVAYGSQIRLRSSEAEAGNDAFLRGWWLPQLDCRRYRADARACYEWRILAAADDDDYQQNARYNERVYLYNMYYEQFLSVTADGRFLTTVADRAAACVLTLSPHINVNMMDREREMAADRKRKNDEAAAELSRRQAEASRLDQLAREHRDRLAIADDARRVAERNAAEAAQSAEMNNQRAAIRLAQLMAEKETAERRRAEAEHVRKELESRSTQLDRDLEVATRNSTSQLRKLQQEKELAITRSREAEQQLGELVRIERERTAAWELQRNDDDARRAIDERKQRELERKARTERERAEREEKARVEAERGRREVEAKLVTLMAERKSAEENYQNDRQLWEEKKGSVAEMERKLTALEEEKQCEICMAADKGLALIPCGHRFCRSCGAGVRECFVCRAPVTGTVNLY